MFDPLPQLVAFDLDDTLAPSKSPMPPQMGEALVTLLGRAPVCIISGGRMEQFVDQVLERAELADAPEPLLRRLHLMPTCGTRYYRHHDGQWSLEYAHDLSETERDEAVRVTEEEARRLGLWEEETWGPALEDRGSQITYSALGQEAPLEAKRAWDPSGEKKSALRDAVAARLPELEVRSGGSTSVDITRHGVDTAYGLTRRSEQTGVDLDDMLFIGDRLDPDGNDYPVRAMGVRCRDVADWEETVRVVTELCAEYDEDYAARRD